MDRPFSNKCYIVEKDMISHNIEILRQRAGSRRIYAVLKADGYGLGCREMAYLCGQSGLRCFAVSDLREAEAVMGSGVAVEELLLMTSAAPEQIPRLQELGVTFSVASEMDAENLSVYGGRAHIKVDTGMGRRGFPATDPAAISALYARFPNIAFRGIYTHFLDGANGKISQMQYASFQNVLQVLGEVGINPGIRHCCSSTAAFYQSDMLLDGIRAGSAILGRIQEATRFGLKKTGICQVRIEAVRELPKGATVGYGGIFHAKKPMTVALCPVGAHHGVGVTRKNGVQDPKEGLLHAFRYLHSNLTGRAVPKATIHGIRCKALGCICSEAVVLDVTNVPCRAGDIALFDINPILLHDVPVEFI